jgi:hypothetical protein
MVGSEGVGEGVGTQLLPGTRPAMGDEEIFDMIGCSERVNR